MQRTKSPDSTRTVALANATAPQLAPSSVGNFRWVICALLLLGATINYMDRTILGVFKTTLQHDLGWSETDYGNVVAFFQGAYAVGMLAMGWLVDRLGTRRGYSVAMILWSAASIATATGRSLVSFFTFRSALGFAEAGVFPASIKAVAEWFPKRERALATGVFNSGTNIGAIVAPLMTLMGLLTAPLQNLVGLIDARIEQLGGDGAATEETTQEEE
jgi:ACS family hexuronate transporter-like MFS transporter